MSPDRIVSHAANTADYRCPRCGGRLWREPRRFRDFIVTAFVPMWRFRCRWISCRWEGRQRVRPEDLANEATGERHGLL